MIGLLTSLRLVASICAIAWIAHKRRDMGHSSWGLSPLSSFKVNTNDCLTTHFVLLIHRGQEDNLEESKECTVVVILWKSTTYSFWSHSVEIAELFYHSDFTWNWKSECWYPESAIFMNFCTLRLKIPWMQYLDSGQSWLTMTGEEEEGGNGDESDKHI